MTDHFAEAEAALAVGDTAAGQVHALLAIAQRIGDGAKLEGEVAGDVAATVAALPAAQRPQEEPAPAAFEVPTVRTPARHVYDVVLRAGEDVAAAVNAARPGSKVLLPPGVIRGVWGLRPADRVELWSDGTTNIRGTTLLPAQNWSPAAGGRWRLAVSVRLLPDFATSENSVDPFDPNVQPEMLFADGMPLRRVKTDPGPGQWALESGDGMRNYLVTGESPNEAVLEFAHAGPNADYDAISSDAEGVLVANLHVSHYALPLFRGAIGRHRDDLDSMGPDWTLRDVAVSDVSAAGMVLGPGATVEGCLVLRCSQTGIRAERLRDDMRTHAPLVLRDTAVRGCGERGQASHEAGGVHVDGLAARGEGLWLSDNIGHGWVLRNDRGSPASGLVDSLVERNANTGIRDERGSAAEGMTRRYVGNIVRGNGTDALLGSDDGAGIALVDTSNGLVEGNVIGDNAGHQLLLADDGQRPGLRVAMIRDNDLLGGRPLVKLRRGRGSHANPRAEVDGADNRWYADPTDRVLILPDGRTATLGAWAIDTDRTVDPHTRPAVPFDATERTGRRYGPRSTSAS